MATFIPALLTRDRQDLNQKLAALSQYCSRIQIDIADGIFVAGQTILPADIPSLPSAVALELHLMVAAPAPMIAQLNHPNINTIIFHYEAVPKPEAILAAIPDRYERGLAINPATPISAINNFLDKLDLVLIMSVEPGAQGRAFIPETINKISQLHRQQPALTIEVDGGLNPDNIPQVISAGANRLVVGSAIFKSQDIVRTIESFRSLIEK